MLFTKYLRFICPSQNQKHYFSNLIPFLPLIFKVQESSIYNNICLCQQSNHNHICTFIYLIYITVSLIYAKKSIKAEFISKRSYCLHTKLLQMLQMHVFVCVFIILTNLLRTIFKVFFYFQF